MSKKNEEATLRPARPEDLEAVLALLRDAALPVQGVAESFAHFTVAEASGEVVGVAGLELYGRDGLLRSVAVASSWRGRGLGAALTDAVVAAAQRRGIADLYLLTSTAAEFFPRHGFRRVERASVAPGVQASIEFAELCPASSTVMMRSLTEASAT